MRQIRMKIIFPLFISIIVSMLVFHGETAQSEVIPLGNQDLKIYYDTIKSLELFATPYKGFTDLAGNTGSWEDSEKYQYTWKDGQAAFIMTGEMKSPQLVQLVLNNSFKTQRGIKKGSTLDEVLKAYPGNYTTTEVTDGTWYVYKWTAGSTSPLINGKNFLLSFYVKDGLVDSVMLKLESAETEGIPVG